MDDIWAAFRQPDATAAALAQNDAPATADQRLPVPSTPKVWGDQEAEAAGLYEGAPDPWAAFRGQKIAQAEPAMPAAPDLSTDTPGFQDNPALERGLHRRAQELTTGPRTNAFQRLALDFQNQGSASSQGTTPNIGAQSKNLISTQVFENDAGEVLFVDPQSGQLVPTDQNKHVALRDPADNRVKVYARTGDTDEGGLSAAGRLLGTGMAAGAPTARPGMAAVAAQAPKASDIFATAKPYYRAFRNEAGGIEVPAETAAGIAERIRGSLGKANLIPELAPQVYAAVGILEKGEPLTLDALQNVKRVVGRGFNSPDKNVRDAASVASAEIGKILGEVAPEAAQNLKTADAIHSTARSVQDLQRKSDVADLRAGRAGYGGNAVNSMRQVLSPIVQRAVEGKVTGFKSNEIEAMREIVEGNTLTNAARGVGQLSPSKGIIQTAGAAGAAMAVGPQALALPAIGMASNKLATILTGRQIDQLKELVAKRSPAYAQAVKRSTERYQKAQEEFVLDPSPSRFAAYLQASRGLSSGLTRDGIQITSGDLLRALPGSVKAGAEEEQD